MPKTKLQLKNWQKVKLEEIADFQYGHTASAEEKDTGTKFLRITDIVPDLINWGAVPFCNIEEEKADQYKIHDGDILIARTGATAGYAKLIRKEPEQSVFASYLIRLKIKDENIDPGFVGRIIESETFKQFVSAHVGGVAQPHANAPVLKNFEICVPPLPTQKQIADILSAYDDLIENNTKRIKILEEIAQAIYKEWFVYFHFPGYKKVKMVDSKTEFGKIPDGWEVKEVVNLGKIITGKTPPKKDSNNFGVAIPFIKTPDLHNKIFCIETGEGLSVKGADTQKNKMLPANTLIVSCIGTLGVVGITSKESQTNQQINAVVLDDRRYLEYGYFLLLDLKQTLRNIGANGATMGNVNKTKFENIEVLFPKEELVFAYHKKVKETFDEILSLQKQNVVLRQARDLLLPKLVSGEIEVKI